MAKKNDDVELALSSIAASIQDLMRDGKLLAKVEAKVATLKDGLKVLKKFDAPEKIVKKFQRDYEKASAELKKLKRKLSRA